jgi:hypothetical protein
MNLSKSISFKWALRLSNEFTINYNFRKDARCTLRAFLTDLFNDNGWWNYYGKTKIAFVCLFGYYSNISIIYFFEFLCLYVKSQVFLFFFILKMISIFTYELTEAFRESFIRALSIYVSVCKDFFQISLGLKENR